MTTTDDCPICNEAECSDGEECDSESETDFDYSDSCDCCVKGWDKPNEFGRCDCIHNCGKLLRECKYKCR